jgi:hypothetical protein
MMRSTTHDLTISAARADALFALAVAAFGIRGCAARVAQAYGEHPETAVPRMRWARTVVTAAFRDGRAEPAGARGSQPTHRAGIGRAA